MEATTSKYNLRSRNGRLPRSVLMTADTVGGVWHYAVDLARGLSERGIEVVMATMGGRATDTQRSSAADVQGLTLIDSEYRLEWMADPWKDVTEAGAWLLDIAADVNPDLIHLNNYAHGALAWERPVLMVGHSCVYSWFAAVEQCEPPASWHRYRMEVARGLAAADAVTAPSAAMLNALRVHYGRFRQIAPIHNGTVPDAFVPGEKEEIVFGAGRLWDAAKNLSMLDAVADEIPWPVLVAGAREHPDGGTASFTSAHTLGLLSRDEMRRWLTKSAIYVLPACYEPFGLSALEAALSGCALVLGDIPSLREVWGDTADFVDPLDPRGLRDAVNRLIEDDERRERQAERARRRAHRYSLDRMTGGYLTAYAGVEAAATARGRRIGSRRPHPIRRPSTVRAPRTDN